MHVRRRRPVKLLLLYCWSPFPTKDIVRDAPAASRRARKSSGSVRKSGLNFLGTFWNFGNIWEIPKSTLSHKTQNLGGHATLERTLTRLKIFFRSVVGNLESTSEINNRDRDRFGEIWKSLGKVWEILGNFEKFWEILGTFGNISQIFRKLVQLPINFQHSDNGDIWYEFDVNMLD